jgi:hypothetical protein
MTPLPPGAQKSPYKGLRIILLICRITTQVSIPHAAIAGAGDPSGYPYKEI